MKYEIPDMHEMSNTRRRVKLYKLNEDREWADHGTGHVSTQFTDDDDNQGTGLLLMMRSENTGQLLLKSPISTDIMYQKQGDTLVVWSEGESGDLALSFQEREGCDEVWNKIQEVQGRYAMTMENGHELDGDEEESFDEVQDHSIPIELPPCELSELDNIYKVIHCALPSPNDRERLSNVIEGESYIPKLIEIFRMCEDLENIEGLHTLFGIFKSFFMLEKNSLFEIMFLPENILNIVGVLEYDPMKKERTPHREFLNGSVRFKEVIPISNEDLLNKIHQTFRVQYIKDILVPVPSLFDESMSTLSSFLFFNKIEIVGLIQEDAHFLDELFEKLTDDEISDDKRKEVVLLLRELCTFSQTLQQENRDSFIRTMANHGLLQSMEQLMNIDNFEMQSAIVDIIYCVVEFNPALVRTYLCKEVDSLDEDSMLLNMLIDLLLNSDSSGLGVILLQLIKTLLDPENMGIGPNKTEKSEFLGFFYRHCMHVLTAPVLAVTATDDLVGKDDFKRATVLDYVIDILTFCVEHHTYQIKNYIVSKDMLRRVLVLMQSKHKFLALASLRFCRKIIGLKDEVYNRYIIVGKLIKPIVQAFSTNGTRYNLLNSAIIELFEFVRSENIKNLCSYIAENYIDSFRDISYVDTFMRIERKYEEEKDRLENKNDRDSGQGAGNMFSSSPPIGPTGIIHNAPGSKKRDDRTMDKFEENWFESEDSELEDLEVATPSNNADTYTSPAHALDDGVGSTKPLSAKLKDVDLLDNVSSLKRTDSPPTPNLTNGPESPNRNRRPTSPQNMRPNSPQNMRPNSPQNMRPNSPQNMRPNSPQNSSPRPNSPINNPLKPLSPQNTPSNIQETIFTKTCINNKPVVNNRTIVNNKLGNKPVVQIRINSTALTLNNREQDLSKNGVTPHNSTDNNHVTEETNHVDNNAPVKSKSLLTSLVDYPDDDEEDEGTENDVKKNDDEIPSSPAKKQRISSN